MAGTGVGKFSSTAGSNTSNLTVNFAENMAPSNVNNAARELMGHIRDMYEQLGDGYFEFGDGDGEYTVARSDADTITITSSSDISSVYFAGRKIRITDGGANVVEGTIASSSHTSTTQTVNLTGISLASGTPTKVELGVDTAAFGGRLILDDDGDTYIEAVTDDTIDIYLAGAKDFVFTANTLTAESGSTIAAQALTATSFTATGDISLDGGSFVFNESSADKDFRVESNGLTHALFVDAGENHVNIGTSTDHGGVFNVESTDNAITMCIVSTDTDANVGPQLKIFRAVTGANNDECGKIEFGAKDSSGNVEAYATISQKILTAADGSEEGRLTLKVMEGGSQRDMLSLDASEVVINDDSRDIDFRVESDGGTHTFFVNSGGNTVQIGRADSDGLNSKLQVEAVDSSSAISIHRGSADSGGAGLHLSSSRGASLGDDTVVQDGDTLGSIAAFGADGTDRNSPAGSIVFQVDGAPGSNDMPGRIVFKTTTNGGVTQTERMRITNAGIVGMGALSNSVDLGVGLHIKTADSGLSSIAAGADELVIENSGDSGMHILSGASNDGNIFFGDSGDADNAYITYDHSTSHLHIGHGGLTKSNASLLFHGTDLSISTNGELDGDVSRGGLCLNQGGSDTQIFSLKSSDVAHGMTSFFETDTMLSMSKIQSAAGGIAINTAGESAFSTMFQCLFTDDSTATSTSAQGPFMIRNFKKASSGTGTDASLNNDQNIFVTSNQSGAKFIIKADGDFFYDGADQGAYDSYDDAMLVRSWDLSHNKNVINSTFDKYVKYNHETLAETNLVGRDEDGTPNHFINVAGMQRLHNGAIWQQFEKHQKLANAMYELAKAAVGEEKANEILEQNEIKLLN